MRVLITLFIIVESLCAMLTPASVAQSLREHDLGIEAFGVAYTAGTMGMEAIATTAEAVWGASELNGGTLTLTGTLTESSVTPDSWSYSSVPTSKLVVMYAGGPTIDLTFAHFEGYIDGTWEDFTLSHNLDFTAFIAGDVDIRVQSVTYPQNDTIIWSRTISGTAVYYNDQMTVSVTHTGRQYFSLGSGFAFYWYWQQFGGTASSPGITIAINQGSYVQIAHDSESAYHARNDEYWNSTSATLEGNTYQFQNAHARWARGSHLTDPGEFNVVIDVSYWLAEGQMLKNSAVWGNVMFDGEVIAGSPGPNLVLRVQGGSDVLLDPIIQGVTNVEETSSGSPDYVVLAQNYPNPFNSSCEISLHLETPAEILLRVFDVMGREVARLADGSFPAGDARFLFDASTLASGTYFCQLETPIGRLSRKMMLLR